MTLNIDLSKEVPTGGQQTDEFWKSGGNYTNLDGDKNSNSSSQINIQLLNGDMGELVDPLDLKSNGPKGPCEFESHCRYN